MKRLLVGALVASCLSLFSASCDVSAGEPAPVTKKAEALAAAKAGVSGARRYQLLFSPDLDVIGALKMAPDVNLQITPPVGTALPWLPTSKNVTLGADIQYISGSEIASVQFMLNGVAIGTTTAAQGFQLVHSFPDTTEGPRLLAVRVTDTDGKITESLSASVTFVKSKVEGGLLGVSGSGSNRSIYGWACSSAYPTPLQVHIEFNLGTGAVRLGTYLANANVADTLVAEVSSKCQSGGSAFGFNVPITDEMYRNHSGQAMFAYAVPATGGTPVMLTRSGLRLINYLPTAGTPTLSPAPPKLEYNGNYIVGERLTFTTQASDTADSDGSVVAVEFSSGAQVLSPCAPIVAGPTVSATCQWNGTEARAYTIAAKATDNRQASNTSSPLTFTLISPTPTLQSGAVIDQIARKVRLTGSMFFPGVLVKAVQSNGSYFGSCTTTSVTTSTVECTLDQTTWSTLVASGLDLKVINPTPGNAVSLEWPSGTVRLEGSPATIKKPLAGSQYPTDQAILIEAQVPNPSVVARVEFLAINASNVTTTLGEAAQAPYALAWNEIPSGTHRLKARAYKASAPTQFSDSSEVSVTVIDDLAMQACPIPGAKSGLMQTLVEMLGLPASLAPVSLSIEPQPAGAGR